MGQAGKQIAAVFSEQNRGYGVRAAIAQPVGPAHDETNVIAKGAARDGVVAAGTREHRAQFGERPGTEQGIDRA